jgi:DNA-binding NarL/FixJ family response regulator
VLRVDGRRHSGTLNRRRVGLLDQRELEVARLIARGYTNRPIAEALVLAPGTVANQVGHILDEIDYSSRVQIATWTLEGGSTTRAGPEPPPGLSSRPKGSRSRGVLQLRRLLHY